MYRVTSHMFLAKLWSLSSRCLPRTEKAPLLPLPNPTSKFSIQAMHVIPLRSHSRELFILLWGSPWRGVLEENEEGS
jgi:hypothetical protein